MKVYGFGLKVSLGLILLSLMFSSAGWGQVSTGNHTLLEQMFISQTRIKGPSASAPTVKFASPKITALKKGSPTPKFITLNGNNLDKVRSVGVIDSAGNRVRGITTRIITKKKTRNKLLFNVKADKSVRTNYYFFQLYYSDQSLGKASSRKVKSVKISKAMGKLHVVVETKKRQKFTIKNTWALKKYLKIAPNVDSLNVGACGGKSIGPSGSHSVGVVKVYKDLNFKIRSGPFGTRCKWKISTNNLRNGWTLELSYKREKVGQLCNPSDGQLKGKFYDAKYRTQHLYVFRKSERRTIKFNEIADRNQFHFVMLKCGVSFNNDNAISMRIDSATVISRPVDVPAKNCTWKCAFHK